MNLDCKRCEPCFQGAPFHLLPSPLKPAPRFLLFRIASNDNVPNVHVVVINDERGTSNVALSGSLDLRGDAGAIARIDVARQHPALGGLLLNLNSEESPFSTVGCKVWMSTESAEPDPSVFASRIDLVIGQRGESASQPEYEELATRLAELLEREPGDALHVELHIAPGDSASLRPGFCLRLVLFARGTGEQQARLRWSLGIARVQQALLFLARAIRQNRALFD